MNDKFLDEADTEDLARMVMALVQEVWTMRDRMAVTEALLAEHTAITAQDINDYAGNNAFKEALNSLRERYTAKVIGAPIAARERSVEQILARAGFSAPKP